jgi:hypothetical protein
MRRPPLLKRSSAPKDARRAAPVGLIEMGRQLGTQDPPRAIRFRVLPYALPYTYIRLEWAADYHLCVWVLETAENGYSLGQVEGAWEDGRDDYREFERPAGSSSST